MSSFLSAHEVARLSLDAWEQGDVDQTLATFAPDASWTIHVAASILEIPDLAGYTRGLDTIKRRLAGLQNVFEYRSFKVARLGSHNSTALARCTVVIRHRETHDDYAGALQLVFRVRDGAIVHLDEYHDAPLLAAYFRYIDLLRGHVAAPQSDHIADQAIALVKESLTAWRNEDFVAVLKRMAPNVGYTISPDGDVFPFGDFVHGHGELLERLQQLRSIFAYEAIEIISLKGAGRSVQADCRVVVRPHDQLDVFDGRLRLVMHLNDDGLIAHIDEDHDARLLDAYRVFQRRLVGAVDPAIRLPSHLKVVTEWLSRWGKADVGGFLAMFSDDSRYRTHLDPKIVSFAGEARGKTAIRDRCNAFRAVFDVLSHLPLSVVEESGRVRAICFVALRIRETGDLFSGQVRLEMGLNDGLVSETDAYHDPSLVEAFETAAGLVGDGAGLSACDPAEFAHVARMCRNYARGDVEAFLSDFPVDATYELHLDPRVFPYAGVAAGRDTFGQRVAELRADFEHLSWQATHIKAFGAGDIRARIETTVRRRRDDGVLKVPYLLVFTFENGRLVRLDEHHDAARLEAFGRLSDGSP